MCRRIAIIICVVTAMVAPATFDAQNQPPAERPPSGTKQPPAKQQPAAPPQPTPPQPLQAQTSALTFQAGAGIILSPIKPDESAVFEEVMGKVKEALTKSADPVRRQQAAGWKVYKAAEPYQGATLYISVLDPSVSGADYNVFEMLQEGFGDKPARELFERFRNAHVSGHNVVDLTTVISMGGP